MRLLMFVAMMLLAGTAWAVENADRMPEAIPADSDWIDWSNFHVEGYTFTRGYTNMTTSVRPCEHGVEMDKGELKIHTCRECYVDDNMRKENK